MKKAIYIIMSLILSVILFTGCTENNKYSIKICGQSDSIPEAPHTLEYSDWKQESFIDPTAEKKTEFVFGDTTIVGNYRRTDKRFPDFYYTHEYDDENGGGFWLTDDGQLSDYFFGNDLSQEENKQIYTESECVDIACDFVSNITDVSQYTITTTFDENQRMYNVSFDKYVGEFRTYDHADVEVEENGHIYSFSSRLLGKIPADAKINFNLEKVNNQVIKKLDEEYSEAKKSYDEVSYESFDYAVIIDENGNYALICIVLVDCIDIQGENKIVRGERMRLLIQHA